MGGTLTNLIVQYQEVGFKDGYGEDCGFEDGDRLFLSSYSITTNKHTSLVLLDHKQLIRVSGYNPRLCSHLVVELRSLRILVVHVNDVEVLLTETQEQLAPHECHATHGIRQYDPFSLLLEAVLRGVVGQELHFHLASEGSHLVLVGLREQVECEELDLSRRNQFLLYA